MTLAALERIVGRLPASVQEVLRLGPVRGGDEFDCRVCEAIGDFGYCHGGAAILMDFHEGRDLLFGPSSWEGWQLGRGPVVYDRCLLIYLAAGWRP